MYMFFFAKSKQLKTLGEVGIIPALFGINEPVLFGVPIVMNPMLAVPFIGMPVIACLIQYFALYTGICPLYGATQIPWTCPPIISGFLLAGWKSALLQLVILCVSFFVYLPFIKKIDKMNLVQEKNQPVEDEAAELIKQGDKAFSLGHNAHADLLTMDANGELSNGYMLLMHAEDQLMSAEGFRILADEFIALYKRIDEK